MTELLILNLIGTFVFGLSGGILAVRKQMDLFGVLVLSVVAALGGGMMRDVLLGHTPPATLDDWRYIAVAASAGVLVFVDHGRVGRWQPLILSFDAAGLGLFTVTGTLAAVAAGLGFVASVLLGMLTGIGGGALRDVLAGEVPFVLRKEIYALASMLGALIIIAGGRWHLPGTTVNMVAVLATFALRTVSVWQGWNIPTASWDHDKIPDASAK
jgi:uncharacterized membrane protein YeiH